MPKRKAAQNELKIYQLFEFLTEDQMGNKEIDFVYKGWIQYDEFKCQLVTYYPPPPYSKKSWDSFNSMVKAQLPPNLEWPTYAINLKGHAATYDEAVEKLKRLENERFVYTDADGEEKAEYITRIIRSKKYVTTIDTKRAMLVPPLDELIPERNSLDENDNDADESEDEYLASRDEINEFVSKQPPEKLQKLSNNKGSRAGGKALQIKENSQVSKRGYGEQFKTSVDPSKKNV